MEPSVRGTPTFVFDGAMIDRIMGSRGEFPDVVCNFDRKTVVQVTGDDEHRLIELIPQVDELVALLNEHRPRLVLALVSHPTRRRRSRVGNREVDGRDDERKRRV